MSRHTDRSRCSHTWIDPDDPPIQRAPYSPIVGPGRRQMKPGKQYVCRNCDLTLDVPASCASELERSAARDRVVVTSADVGELPPIE